MSSNNNSSNGHQPIAGALTYPSSNGGSVQPVPVQPRQPRNLQGLLRFAMEATKVEDAPGNSDLGPMDEERRKFLEEAFRSLTVDVVSVMQTSIRLLSDPERMHSIRQDDMLPADVLTAFNNLLEYIDDIDVANDFYKLGGFSIFPVCFGSESSEVRAQACTVLAELCQNNPYCQARALDCGLLSVLLSLLQTERGNALCKCLYAISCACRSNPAACSALARGGAAGGGAAGGGAGGGACGALAGVLRAPELNARTKAAFFIYYLCRECDEARERFVEQNVVAIVAEQLRAGRDEAAEQLVLVLLALLQLEEPRALPQCRDPALRLQETLERYLQELEEGGEEVAGERDTCREVLRRLRGGEGALPTKPADDEADR